MSSPELTSDQMAEASKLIAQRDDAAVQKAEIERTLANGKHTAKVKAALEKKRDAFHAAHLDANKRIAQVGK